MNRPVPTRREFLRAFASTAAAPAAMAALPVAATGPQLMPVADMHEIAQGSIYYEFSNEVWADVNKPTVSLYRWYTGPTPPADYFEFFGLPRPAPILSGA